MASIPVMLIGGAGPPANIDFSPLLQELQAERPLVPITPVAFQGGPFSGITLTEEVNHALRHLDEGGYAVAHVVGYSGGAAVGLALADMHAGRVASLMLEEPAWVGNQGIPQAEREEIERLASALSHPPFEAVSLFRELMIEPDVLDELKPLPPDAAWLPDVVRGVLAFIAAFRGHDLDWGHLRNTRIPMRFAVGSRSNPVFEARSRRAAARVPGTSVDVYQGLHHLNPPHRGAAERFAESLRRLWQRAESEARVRSRDR